MCRWNRYNPQSEKNCQIFCTLPNFLPILKEQVSTKTKEINTTKKKPFLRSTDSHEISCHSIASQKPILWLVKLLNSICPCVARWHQSLFFFTKRKIFETLDVWNPQEARIALGCCLVWLLRFFGLSNLPHVSIIQQLQTVS